MKTLLSSAAVAAICLASAATAATLDLTNRNFDSEVSRSFTEDGVGFTITAINNLVGGPRLLGGDNGLQVAGGGGSTLEFSLSVDMDVTLTGYSTDGGGGFRLGSPTFDLFEGLSVLIDDGQINDGSGGGVTVAGLDIDLTMGTNYIFLLEGFGAGVQGFFTAFDFDKVIVDPPVVPLPAGFPLMLAGLGAFAFIRRKA